MHLKRSLRRSMKRTRKKLEEEDLQVFHAKIKKNPQDNVTPVEETKSPPPCSNQVEPSETSKQEYEALHSNKINEENKDGSANMVNSVIEKAESKNTCVESIESKDACFVEQEHGECETTMLDFSICKGTYMLPCEFRAKETNDHKKQLNIAERCSVDKEYQSEEARDPEQQEDMALENHLNVGQVIVHVIQPSCSTNVFKEVSLANNLLIFRFGQKYIVHAFISNIRNIKRPIMNCKLFVSNKMVTKHIGQHVVPFRETDIDKLLQPKLSILFHLNFISTWVALLTSYLAYIWSQVRHVCYNYFGFRNLRPRLVSCEKADDSITTYSNTSEKECESQHIAE